MAATGRFGLFVALAAIAAGSLAPPLVAQDRQPPAVLAAAPASAAPATLTLEQQEAFLKSARIVRTRPASKGVTNTVRATLSDGTLTHDASIQTIDEYMTEFRSNRGTELNFRDSWRYNVAAYRLDRLLELNMIPPSVERRYNGKAGAFTWWVDDVLMDEGKRYKEKISAPSPLAWNQQMWIVRMFDQLIHNTDRNLGNLLIDTRWTIWMIDHSRAFRLNKNVRAPENLARIERHTLARLKALDFETLKTAMEDYLTPGEIKSLLERRDDIVAHFEKMGEAAFFQRVR